jgi:hypothetical protein
MVSLDVVMLNKLVDNGIQMTLAKWNNMPQALGFDRTHKSFGKRVQVGTVCRESQEFDIGRGQELLEVVRVQWVSVDDEVAETIEWAGDGIGQVARDLRHPRAVGMGRDARDVDSTRLEVDDEENQVTYEAADGEDLDAEEVRGGDGTPVRLEKRVPRHGPSAHRRGLDAVLLENALNRRASKVQAQIL